MEDPHGEKPTKVFDKDYLWREYGLEQNSDMIEKAFSKKGRLPQTVAYQAYGLLTQLENHLNLRVG